MNDAIQERSCWSMLLQKAEEKLELIQLELVQTQQRLSQLEASRQRLQTMYEGYSAQSTQLGQAKLGMSHSLMMRQFMSQLQSLIKRVDTDTQHTLNLRAALHEKMAECEKERIKMSTLAERSKAESLAQARQRELNQMNEWATLQFNRNKAA